MSMSVSCGSTHRNGISVGEFYDDEVDDMISKQEASEMMGMERRPLASSPLNKMKAQKEANPEFTVDEIASALGRDSEEFLNCMAVVEAIIDNPAQYTGVKAGIEATRLAALRTKIGAKAQMYKSAAVGNADLRKRKDVLMTMYDALLENINTLKGMAKYERDIN